MERRIPWWSFAVLAAAVAAVAVRWWQVGASAWTYDEATYVDWSQHVLYSRYYPEDVFVRHPPAYPLLLGAWTALTGTGEAAVRAFSATATMAGIALLWDGLRRARGDAYAATGAAIAGASFLVWWVGIQATMYPLAFAFAALALWGHLMARPASERTGIVLLALTHWFGLLVLLIHLAWDWHRHLAGEGNLVRRVLRSPGHAARLGLWTLPALLWLAAALVLEITQSATSTGRGPGYQAARSLDVLLDLGPALLLHVLVFTVGVLALMPPLLRRALGERAWKTGPWPMAFAALLVFVALGPAFLRYWLLLVPFALALGLKEVDALRDGPRIAFFAVVAVLAGALLTSASVPDIQNDALGAVDWQEATDRAWDHGWNEVATPVPTSVAHYWLEGPGQSVDRSQGPERLSITGFSDLRVVRFSDEETLLAATQEVDAALVPDSLSGLLEALEDRGWVECYTFHGGVAWATGATCSATA